MSMSLYVLYRWCKYGLNNFARCETLSSCSLVLHLRNSSWNRNSSFCGNTVLKDNILNCSHVRFYCTVIENTRIKEGALRYFTYYGFKYEDTSTLIKSCPDITRLSEDKLNEILNCWAQCNFGEDRMTSLILKHPNLILIQCKQVQSLHVYLSSKFKKSEVYEIFFSSPQLLKENIDSVNDKLYFLEEEFNITKSQIAKSGVLQYTLDFIKKRIEFLIRVGVYKKLQPKKSTHVNPRLDIIVRTSDKEFSTKVAGVTLLEYEVFQQIFQKEEDDD